jgi:hypothetical protein
MTDEYQDVKDEEIRKNLKVFRPIGKDDSYDPKTFAKAQGNLNDLEGYIQRLSQPNGHADVSARRDISGLLYGDENEQLRRPTEHLMSEARDAQSSAVENMGRYMENNSGQVMNRLDGKSLANLVLNSHPLYLTGNEKHDKVAEDILELRALNSSDEKTAGEAQKSIMKRINEDKEVPDWIKISIQRYAGRESSFVPMIVSRYVNGQNKALSKYLTNGDKPDESKLRGLINNSLRAAYDKFDDVPSGKENDEERNDIWEQNIRPCYLTIAKELRSVEKKKIDEKDSKKQESKAREKDRNSLGMAA